MNTDRAEAYMGSRFKNEGCLEPNVKTALLIWF